MKDKKSNKAFTLVELIVVMAVIAILAAIAVPTSLHFVKKAEISKELQQMNVMDSVQGIFLDAPNNQIDLSETTDNEDNKFSSYLLASSLPYRYLGKVQVDVSGEKDQRKIVLVLKGQQFGEETNGSILSLVFEKTFKDDQIFCESKDIPKNDVSYIYSLNKTNGSISYSKE